MDEPSIHQVDTHVHDPVIPGTWSAEKDQIAIDEFGLWNTLALGIQDTLGATPDLASEDPVLHDPGKSAAVNASLQGPLSPGFIVAITIPVRCPVSGVQP